MPQEFVTAYFIVSIPADNPDTTPLATVAIVELLLQIPPLTVSVSVIVVPPAHKVEIPLIPPA